MSLTLYDAFVPSCQQLLDGMKTLIDMGEAHVKDHGLQDAELIEAKLAEDMWTLPWHVRACWVHSSYAIDQLATGEFTPDFTDIPDSWDAMRAMASAAQERLGQISVEDVDKVADETIGFILGGKRLMEMKGTDFLLGFNQPNFYFHATTFYDILRYKGVALGKRAFMGPPRTRG